MIMLNQKILINNLEVNYKIAGHGPVVLLLHGWGGSSDSWINVGEILSKEFKVIIPDFPGFGKTPPPNEIWGVGDYADFIFDFTKQLEINSIFLLGHSLGGRISIKFLNKYPEIVNKVIFCNSAGIKHDLSLKSKIIFTIARIGNAILSPKHLSRAKDAVRNIFYTFIRNKDYVKANEIMKKVMIKVIAEDLSNILSNITTESLIIVGERDKYIPPKDAELFNKRIKNSKLETLEDIGHSPHLECPERLSKIIISFFK